MLFSVSSGCACWPVSDPVAFWLQCVYVYLWRVLLKGDTKNRYKILVGKTVEKRQLKTFRRNWILYSVVSFSESKQCFWLYSLFDDTTEVTRRQKKLLSYILTIFPGVA